MRLILAALLLLGTAAAIDLQPGGHPALPEITFPVTSAGMCLDGAEQLFSDYQSAGLNPSYMYSLPDDSGPGHVWVAVPDGGRWLAIDSYWGPMTDGGYYSADGMYGDIESLEAAFPRERIR